MKAIDRFIQYLDLKKIKPTRFEKEVGLSNGYIGTQKKRNADLGEGVVVKIIDYCRDLNVEWLLTGNGTMLRDERPTQPQESVQEPLIIYKSDPKDLAIIADKERIIADKERIIALLEDKIMILQGKLPKRSVGAAPVADTTFGAGETASPK